MSETVLVTGGAGFIGSHLCESLLSDGHRVICLDDLSSGRRSNVRELLDDERFTFVEGDVRNPIEETLPGAADADSIDRIYHLASRASPTEFSVYPEHIATTNTTGTRRVLDLAVAVGARVLYASTSEVYGDPEQHPQSEVYNGNVNPVGPRACYDESKRFGETLTRIYHDTYGVDVRVARLFNTYGPRMRPGDGRVVPTFLRQAIRGDDLTVHGDGKQTRSFLYVSDQIRGLQSLMTAPGMASEVVNIGSTTEIEITDLAETIIELTESDADIEFVNRPRDDPQRRKPDISRAQREIGWNPRVGLRDGIERTIPGFERQVLAQTQK